MRAVLGSRVVSTFITLGCVGVVDPGTFWVLAAKNFGRRRLFRDKRWDVGGRKRAVFAEIVMSTREPNEVTASIHDEREGLRRSAKAEGNGVASIAVGKEWCGGGGGGSTSLGGGGLGVFEVVGSF